MSTDRKANAPGRTGPIAHELGKIRVGRLPTMNQDEYPGLSGWWVQLRIGEDGEEVLARVYGNTPEQAHSRATALAGQPGQALTQQTLDDVMAGIPARDAEIEALRKEIETLRAQQDTDRMNALPPLNDDLIAILGRPNFMCAQLADTLRSGGHDIAERAENEQAAVIHFLLGHYLADPAQWAEKASAALKAARKEQA